MSTRQTKILVLSANPKNTDRLRLDQEIREIEEGLKRSKHRDKFVIHSKLAVRFRDFRRAMLDYEPEIVHFSGHGEADGIVLEDDNGDALSISLDTLTGLFQLFENQVKCVLLNACYSDLQAKAINQHINYVIGMANSITDISSVEFSVAFYDALGAGKSIEESYRFGCNTISLCNLEEELTPVLLKNNHIPLMNPTENIPLNFSIKDDNLEKKLTEYQFEYDYISEKIEVLQIDYKVSMYPAHKNQLKNSIIELEEKNNSLFNEIKSLEKQLGKYPFEGNKFS